MAAATTNVATAMEKGRWEWTRSLPKVKLTSLSL